jgi:hypothetical protein
MDAAQQTTHPSALRPAISAVEAILRGKLHPNFIRSTMANANRPLIILLRILGIFLILFGVSLDAAFVLSTWSQFWRISCIPLWFTGFAIFISAVDGVDLVLHTASRRQLRPWELGVDLEAGSKESIFRRHLRKGTDDSALTVVDPLRKPSLQTLGPKNDFVDDPWVTQQSNTWLLRRTFDITISSQNKYLRILQNGVVIGAVLWSGAITFGLALGSLFIPSANLF